ncbi:GNAT family N-acetyltransferase [Candidatus Lokiarchaeum ossiferum]|uniref:GNAT family N-acetyltransferase n=1 Tax=Candidatus Lokiarchaeum ossiferum TaxID=2951803 RepID=UPI00352CA297
MKIGIFYNYISSSDELESDRDITSENEVFEIVELIRKILEINHIVIPIQITRNNLTLISQSHFDLVINLCEGIGINSEAEAYIPAFLDLLEIPYTGSNNYSLALCNHKDRVKNLLIANDILTPKHQIFHEDATISEMIINFPLIVKPLHEDASIGITFDSVVYNHSNLSKQVEWIWKNFNQPALVEEFIDGREINVAIMGNGQESICLPISEIIFDYPPEAPRIIDYDCKWIENSISYKHAHSQCPANIDLKMQEKLEIIAKKVFLLSECRDYARVDFRIRNDEIYVLEINPNPCISPDSGFFRSAMAARFKYDSFILKLLEVTCRRYQFDIENSILENFINVPIYSSQNLNFYPISMEYLTLLERWFNDYEIAKNMAEPEYIEDIENLVIKYLVNEQSLVSLREKIKLKEETVSKNVKIIHKGLPYLTDRISLIVHFIPENKMIGYCSIYNISTWNQFGEISFLIGEEEYRGKGYSKEIVKSLLDISINYLDLHRIEAEASEMNKPSQKALECNGFRKIGLKTHSHLLKDHWSNDILYEFVDNHEKDRNIVS